MNTGDSKRLTGEITKRIGALAFGLGLVLLMLTGAELYVEFLLENPAACPDGLLPTVRHYYEHHDRDVFQTHKGRTHFDSDLFYAMNPGRFTFSNREFSNVFEVNSAGFRDDEISLLHPEVVVLGDSYAMGWGVDNGQTFASLIEEGLDLSVLNTAVSSYGTAREITALSRVNTTEMDYLIIQYCPNDLTENQNFVSGDHSLIVSGEAVYDDACAAIERKIAYFPFKHTVSILQSALRRNRDAAPRNTLHDSNPARAIGAAAAFLDIVGGSESIPKHTQIIVFSLEAEKVDGSFIEQVTARLDLEYGSSLHDRMTFVDLSGHLDKSHRYILDPHLNAAGQRAVADRLLDHIAQLNRPTGFKEWSYPSGAPAITCAYVDGLKEGLFTAFWENGGVSRTSWYKRGARNGLETDFSRGGFKIAERAYLEGRLHGWSTIFGDDGLIERTYYERGEIVDSVSK